MNFTHHQSASASPSIAAVRMAWESAQTMTPNQFAELSTWMLNRIGNIYEYRYDLDMNEEHDLSSFIQKIWELSEMMPTVHRDLMSIVHSDPRAMFRTPHLEWIKSLQHIPADVSQLSLVWSDSTLNSEQRAMIYHFTTIDLPRLQELLEQASGRLDLNVKFLAWLRKVSERRGMTVL